MPTYIYYVPPSDVSEYTHYTPSESFNFHLEFDYPSYWWLQEYSDEVAILRVHKLIISLTPAILGEQEQKHAHRAKHTPM
jgi:hypothetical protein